MRLLTIHNLAYLQRLMAELRAAIDADRLAAAAAAVRDGAAPWELARRDEGRGAFKARCEAATAWSAARRRTTYDALIGAARPRSPSHRCSHAALHRRYACWTSVAARRARRRRGGARRARHRRGPRRGMVAEARRRHPDLRFIEADAEQLPFDDDTFDVALGAFLVNHLPDAPSRGR